MQHMHMAMQAKAKAAIDTNCSMARISVNPQPLSIGGRIEQCGRGQ
jgi:hypothetical protein